MTRKISGHDGDLVVNDAVELDGEVRGQLDVEPGGSVVVRGSVAAGTASIGDEPAVENHEHNELDDVVSDIP